MCSLYSFLKEYIFVYACSRSYDCSYVIVFKYLYAGGRAVVFVRLCWGFGEAVSVTPVLLLMMGWQMLVTLALSYVNKKGSMSARH